MHTTPAHRSFFTAGALAVSLLVGGSLASAAPAVDVDTAATERAVAAQQLDRQIGPRDRVAMPHLASTHGLPSGGMNLWVMPLTERLPGFGVPEWVNTLDTGWFSYTRSRTLAGNFGNLSPSDDGSADHVIWHAQPDGSVIVWGVAGATDELDRQPRYWAELRSTAGWSFDHSVVLSGDVTGDGWDDLVVVHRTWGNGRNLWVFRSTGFGLGAPELWRHDEADFAPARYLLADLDYDRDAELITIRSRDGRGGIAIGYSTSNGFGFHPEIVVGGEDGGGWSFDRSNQLLGDVTGDGYPDLLSVHAQEGNEGMLVWVHRGELIGHGVTFAQPQIWQDLRTGGWSYEGSRHHLADTNADSVEDLVSVHSQVGILGALVWRHVSSHSPEA